MFERGKMYHRRTDLHARFGGNAQSGIAPCAEHPCVFLFTARAGEQYGYQDRWLSATLFSYTGEGKSVTWKWRVETAPSSDMPPTVGSYTCSRRPTAAGTTVTWGNSGTSVIRSAGALTWTETSGVRLCSHWN